MQQIAVGAMHLDPVDAEPRGAPRRRHEGVAEALQAGSVERARRRFAFLVRHIGGTLGLPAAFRDRDQLPPSHGLWLDALRPAWASWIASFRMPRHRAATRLSAASVASPQAEAARRDAAVRLHRGRLDAEHRRARQRQRVDMREVPVIGLAVLGGILAHRRHHDAIGKRQAAQRDRFEEAWHGGQWVRGERSVDEQDGKIPGEVRGDRRQQAAGPLAQPEI